MELIFRTKNWGDVQIRDIIDDVDGTNLDEGMEVKSLDDEFENFQVEGYSTFDFDDDNVEEGKLDRLIDNNV